MFLYSQYQHRPYYKLNTKRNQLIGKNIENVRQGNVTLVRSPVSSCSQFSLTQFQLVSYLAACCALPFESADRRPCHVQSSCNRRQREMREKIINTHTHIHRVCAVDVCEYWRKFLVRLAGKLAKISLNFPTRCPPWINLEKFESKCQLRQCNNQFQFVKSFSTSLLNCQGS